MGCERGMDVPCEETTAPRSLRDPVEGGEFTYFTCFCFFDISDLDIVDHTLIVRIDAVGLSDALQVSFRNS